MLNTIFSITALADIGLLGAMIFLAVRIYSSLAGRRRVVCSEAGKPALVEMDAARAVWTFGFGEKRIAKCTLWPEWRHCKQECLAEIEQSGSGCRLSSLLAAWYEGESCALCGTPFGHVRFGLNGLALMGKDGITREWGDVARSDPSLPDAYQPVCWTCHLRGAFTRAHDRASHQSSNG